MANVKIQVTSKIVNNKQLVPPGTHFEETVVFNGRIVPKSQVCEEGISSNGGGIK